MNKLSVDKDLCVKCGICSKICPVSIISKDADSYPFIDNIKKLFCINCGQCEAYCPKKALTLSYSFETESVPELTMPSITPDALEQHIKNRRSVRSFKAAPVEKSSIEKTLDIVRYAPTGKNGQDVAWSIIYGKDEMLKILDAYYEWLKKLPESDSPFKNAIPVKAALKLRESGAEMIFRGAPHCAIAHTPSDAPMGKASFVDSVIAITTFDLALPSFGLGGFWAGFFTMGLMDSAELRQLCKIPEKNIVGYAYAFGTPLHKTYSIPKRKKTEVAWM
jgi:nitroreductase/NAD-dependent dihydropyrimidine dehydrogenase PreA subunit